MAFDGVGVSTSGQAPPWLPTDLQQLGEIFCAVSGSLFWKGRHETVRDTAQLLHRGRQLEIARPLW